MSDVASSSTARFTPRIPTEILLRIFRMATGDAVSPEYVPFSRNITAVGLSVKLAIVLVCKRWRAIGAQFLYEDIKVTPRHFDFLLDILDRTGEFESKPNGHYVRRLTFTPTRVDMDAAVLKCCPYVETLIKPPMHKHDGDTPIASFPFPDRTITTFEFVQHIDWSFSSTHCPNQRILDDSISFFWHLVQVTPSLRYLSLVGSKSFTYHLDPALFSDVDSYLSRLRVLRLENMIQGEWNLPSLTHLVTDDVSHCDTLRPLVVELGMTTCAVDRFLQLCPQLQELSYDLSSSVQPARYIAENAHLVSSIECVRLRVRGFQATHEMVMGLDQFFAGWCGPRFPSLKRCILHCGCPIPRSLGMYTAPWKKALRARGCTLEWAA